MLNYCYSLDNAFHALADPTRRGIVERLAQGNASVKELSAPFKMSLPAVMLHLQILEDKGLVRSEKKGRVRTCSLNRDAISAIESWVEQRKANWNRMFDHLEAHLDEEANS